MKLWLKEHWKGITIALLLLLPVSAFAEVNFVHKMIWGLVVSLFGTILGWSAVLLDGALGQFVIDFGTLFRDSGLGATIDTLWVSVRDIFNITFIFGLVYIGFKMILNSDDSNTRRWLIYLILAALLVNFSLFFTKVVVDVSNMLATEIAMDGFDLGPDGYPSIGATFMNNVGLQSVLANSDDLELGDLLGDGAWSFIFGTMILFIVATFVFAAGALLLFIRFAVLLLYMVLSPFMFIGWVLPQLQRYTSEYWSGFLGRAFFAPLYILFTYLSMQIISSYYAFATLGGGADFAGALNGTSDAPAKIEGSFMPFILACIFMIASIVAANKLGANGATASLQVGRRMAQATGRYARRKAGDATFGGAAWVSRNTAGRAANAFTQSDKGKSWGASRNALQRVAYKATSGIAGSSFDARNVGGLGKTTGLGTGSTGGYRKSLEDKQKAELDYAKKLGTVQVKNSDGSFVSKEMQKKVETGVANTATVVQATSNRDKAQEELTARRAALASKQTQKLDGKSDPKQIDREITELEAQVTEANKALDASQKKLESAEKAAEAIVVARETYRRQLEYAETLKKSGQFWSGKWKVSGSGATGAVAGSGAAAFVAGGGLLASAATGGVGGVVGALATSSYGAGQTAAAQKIIDTYGESGEKMIDKEQKKKNFDLYEEVRKELGVKEEEKESSDNESNA